MKHIFNQNIAQKLKISFSTILLFLTSCGSIEKKDACSISYVHVIPNNDISTEVMEYGSSMGKSAKSLRKDSVLNDCLRSEIEKILNTSFYDVYSSDLTFNSKAIIISSFNSSKQVAYGGVMKGDSLLLFEGRNTISNEIRIDKDNRDIYFRIFSIQRNDTLDVETIRITYDILGPSFIGRDDGYTKW